MSTIGDLDYDKINAMYPDSASDTTYLPSDDDIDTSTSDTNSLVSEEEIPSAIPPLDMSEIERMPTVDVAAGTNCAICWDIKYHFVKFTCCEQIICKDCTVEWLLLAGSCILCRENIFAQFSN